MIDKLGDLFRQDFWLKVLATALAVLLWAMVMRDYNKEQTVSLDVLLEVIQHPRYEMFEGKQDKEIRVEVRATGPSLLVSSLRSEDIRAWVDYSRVTEAGRSQDVEVQISGPPRVKEQVKYRASPSTISVTLIERTSASVPVTVTPDAGVTAVGTREFKYTVAATEQDVLITGRKDALNRVHRAQVTLEGRDLEPPLVGGVLGDPVVRITKPVTPLDLAGKVVENIAPPHTDVQVTWEELPPGKQVRITPITVGNVPPGFELVGVSVEPSTITLRSGAVDGTLPDVAAINTEPVDLSGQTKSFTTAVRVLPPAGTSVAQTSVNVTVTIAEVKIEKIFGALPVTVVGQSVNADVVLSPQTVQVRLTGPFTQVNPLDAGSIQVQVEVGGLPEGQHRLPVKVKYPPGIPEVAVDPAMIEVMITNR